MEKNTALIHFVPQITSKSRSDSTKHRKLYQMSVHLLMSWDRCFIFNFSTKSKPKPKLDRRIQES